MIDCQALAPEFICYDREIVQICQPDEIVFNPKTEEIVNLGKFADYRQIVKQIINE